MRAGRTPGKLASVPTYLVRHHHAPDECRFASAAWEGSQSPLRHRSAISSCIAGDHSLWLTVEADDESAALEQLPPYIAERSSVVLVREVAIP